MQDRYEGSEWAKWAEYAGYEMDELVPGKEAPVFTATTWEGFVYDASEHYDGLMLLEFVDPRDRVFLSELGARETLVDGFPDGFIDLVTVSVEPDSAVNAALFEDRDSRGVTRIALPDGRASIVARLFNVTVVPKRFLLHDGVIVAKYTGGSVGLLRLDLEAIRNRQGRSF